MRTQHRAFGLLGGNQTTLRKPLSVTQEEGHIVSTRVVALGGPSYLEKVAEITRCRISSRKSGQVSSSGQKKKDPNLYVYV